MSISCHECGSPNIRQAQFHLSDTLQLLAFRYPVRCRSCRKRWHAPLKEARQLPPSPGRRTSDAKT